MKRPMYPPNKLSPERCQGKKAILGCPSSQAGQGFTEYAIILMLVGISVVLIISVMGPTLEGVFSRIAHQDKMAPPNLVNYTPPPRATDDPSGGTPTATPTDTPEGFQTPTPSITPTATETATQLPTASATPTATTRPPLSNLCYGNPNAFTTQSSTNSGGVSDRACDGNTDGNWNNDSVSRTNSESNAYWEVNLGQSLVLQQLKIFNRTDADVNDLSNFYVFTTNSINGFGSTDLNTTRNDPNVREYYFEGGVDSLAFALNNVSARNIRIQLGGTGNLNLAEVEIIGADYIADQCESLADMFYIFDTSGSMAWSFPGASSKIAAAKDAVITVNNEIAAAGGDSRVGFVTFTTNGTYWDGSRDRLSIDLDTIPLTTNIAWVNSIVNNWQAVGGTPTGAAINEARLKMIETWDPLRTPVVVLVSDGVPTVDQDGLYYADSHVQNISVYDNNGDPYTADYVENTGTKQSGKSYYSSNKAGYVVADTMREIQELKNSLPNVTVHSIALGSGGFNTEVLQYVADVGGGSYVSADDSNKLVEELMNIFNSISCNPDS